MARYAEAFYVAFYAYSAAGYYAYATNITRITPRVLPVVRLEYYSYYAWHITRITPGVLCVLLFAYYAYYA